MNFSACFRRFIRRPISLREASLINSLERQRKRSGIVRAYVNDPGGEFHNILIDYVRWHQARLSLRDAIIITPKMPAPRQRRKSSRFQFFTAKRNLMARGICRPIGQIILFQADSYSRHLQQTLASLSSYLSGTDTILIVVGNAENHKSVFAQLFKFWNIKNERFVTISNPVYSPPCHQPPKEFSFNHFYIFILSNFTLKPPVGFSSRPISCAFLF